MGSGRGLPAGMHLLIAFACFASLSFLTLPTLRLIIPTESPKDIARRSRPATATATAPQPQPQQQKPRVRLVVAIGSKPSNEELREWVRSTWMTWGTAETEIRFFMEETPGVAPRAENRTRTRTDTDTDTVVAPAHLGGYWGSAPRFFHQVRWFLERYDFDYFLRIDDDGFLCLPRLLAHLRSSKKKKNGGGGGGGAPPRTNFFWGKYFCTPSFVLPDENFMLFSTDVARFLADGAAVLRINERASLGGHFSLWQRILDLRVFDDREQIHAQQEFLPRAAYMQTGVGVGNFCADHIWSHYVRKEEVFRRVFDLANETADAFSEAKHEDAILFPTHKLNQVCHNYSGPRGQKEECLGPTENSIFNQRGNVPGFQGSKGFPTILSNEQYNCRSSLGV